MTIAARTRENAADGLYDRFVEAILTGHLKSGAKLPTMQQIAAENGVTFRVARSVVERLGREGYVRSRPHAGTVVRTKKHGVWSGHVLFVSFADDCASFFVAQVTDALRSNLVKEGYLMTSVVASRSSRGDVSQLKTALSLSVDFVVLMYASPHLERLVSASGFPYAVIYGTAPSRPNAWSVPFDLTDPSATFLGHCAKAGVRSVTEVRFKDASWPSLARELKAIGVGVRSLTIEPLAGFGRYEGIERAAMERFLALKRSDFPDLYLFWDDFVAQGALTALLANGVRIPEDVRVVVQTNKGLGPVFPQALTRFECDGASVGEKMASFALAVLRKGRLPSVPRLGPVYVFGKTFPWIRK